MGNLWTVLQTGRNGVDGDRCFCHGEEVAVQKKVGGGREVGIGCKGKYLRQAQRAKAKYCSGLAADIQRHSFV